jgi:hypothetical protein
MRSVPCFVIAATLLVVGVPARAHADPIVLTNGFVGQSSGNDLPGFTVSGSGSSFTGVLGVAGVVCCVFGPGDVVRLDWSFPVTALPFQTATQTVDGTAFHDTFLRGQMTFTAVPFVAPAIAGSDQFSFTTPFTMTGQISGFTGSLAEPFQVFSVPVAGSGSATVGGHTADNGALFVGTFLGFDLQDPAPTPEPATLILVGAALAGGLGAAARRRRSAAPNASRT